MQALSVFAFKHEFRPQRVNTGIRQLEVPDKVEGEGFSLS